MKYSRSCILRAALLFAGSLLVVPGMAPAQQDANATPGITVTESQRIAQFLEDATTQLAIARNSTGRARLESLEKAAAWFEAVGKSYPGNTAARFGMAEVYREQERLNEARGQYSLYIDTPAGRNDHRAYERMGRVFLKSKYFRQAQPLFRKAATLNAASATAWEGLAQAHLGTFELTEAYEAIVRARESQPNNVDVLETFVKICDQDAKLAFETKNAPRIETSLSHVDEAVSACRTAVIFLTSEWENSPTNVEHLARMSVFYGKLVSLTEKQLIATPTPAPETVLQLVDTYEKDLEVQRLITAHRNLAYVTQGLLAVPESAELLMKKAQLEQSLKMKDEAIGTLQQLVTLDSNHQEGKSLLDELTQ